MKLWRLDNLANGWMMIPAVAHYPHFPAHTPQSKWITLSDSWPIIDPSWWITQPWGRENWALRWPVNIKWRCLQSVRALHNGPQCDIVPAQTRGWHLEFFTIPPLRLCDNNPELLPAPACVIHNGRRKFVFSSIQGCCQMCSYGI